MTVKVSMMMVLVMSLITACSRGPAEQAAPSAPEAAVAERETIWDLFDNGSPNTTIRVNKYIWSASLEVLGFLPLESADPFTGILQFGYGRAPGSQLGISATVLVQDPALDARSLKLSLRTRNGAASNDMIRDVEDAILTRARQLRLRDASL